jgi:hypothetical protein
MKKFIHIKGVLRIDYEKYSKMHYSLFALAVVSCAHLIFIDQDKAEWSETVQATGMDAANLIWRIFVF